MELSAGYAPCGPSAWRQTRVRDGRCNCTRRKRCCSRPAPCSRVRPLPSTGSAAWWWSTGWRGWSNWESASPATAEYRQRRVVVEHRLARLVQLGIGQSRYFGRIKTRFQLYLAATVANLTLVAAKAGLTGETGGASSAGIALRTGTIRSAFDFVLARIGQILTLTLLASASLPEYTSPNKGFRPDC